jgi:hypothetical protein
LGFTHQMNMSLMLVTHPPGCYNASVLRVGQLLTVQNLP